MAVGSWFIVASRRYVGGHLREMGEYGALFYFWDNALETIEGFFFVAIFHRVLHQVSRPYPSSTALQVGRKLAPYKSLPILVQCRRVSSLPYIGLVGGNG